MQAFTHEYTSGDELRSRYGLAHDQVAFQRIPPGVRYMAAGAFFFSLMSLLVKVAGQRLPSQEIVLARSVVILVLSYGVLRRAGTDLRGHNRQLLVVRGVLGFTALSAFYYAVVHLPLADATVIQYTNPIFAGLIAVRVLDERIGGREAGAVLASLTGVVLVARPSFLFGESAAVLDPVAVAIGLAGAVFSAAAYVTVRKLRVSEDPVVIVFYFAIVSVLGAVPTALPGALWPTPAEWVALLGVGVATYLGQIYLTRGLHLERAGRATAIGYLQIIFAAIWGAFFFAEYPDGISILGAGLIIAGTLALSRPRNRTL